MPLSVKVTLPGRAPLSVSAGVGVPVAVTEKVPDVPTMNVPLPALVNAGAAAALTMTAAENSEVLPTPSVAVAVTTRPAETATLRETLKAALPLASVVALRKPRNCCPSAMPPAGSASLAKNSTRNVESGVVWSVPAMTVWPLFSKAEVNTGKFW